MREFTGKIDGASKSLQTARRPAMNAAALAAKQTMLSAPGAPKFLRGVGRRGAKVGVRYTLYGQDKAVVRWVGPAHLLNNPTKPHDIRPKARKRRGGKRAIVIAGTPVAVAHHPGTKGRHFYERSKPQTMKVASAAYQRSVRDAVARSLK